MLPKKNRANKNKVERVFKEGKFVNSPFFSFKFILNKQSNTRQISVVVPKSVSKLAVSRNRLRRLGYQVLEQYLDLFPAGIEGVLMFKRINEDILAISNEIKQIASKIN